MAKSRRMSFNPAVRSLVRGMIRSGESDASIRAEVESRFPNEVPGRISRELSREHTRQNAVDRIMAKPLRDRTNLHALLGCSAGEVVVARVVIAHVDPDTRHQQEFQVTLALQTQGLLQDILNDAIRRVTAAALAQGYIFPHITSSMKGGTAFYRLDFAECRGSTPAPFPLT